MSVYPLLSQIKDPTLRQALKLIFDKVAAVEGQTAGIGAVTQALSANLNANAKRLTSVADPTAATDAVTLQYLRQYVQGAIALDKQVVAIVPPVIPGAPVPLPPTPTGDEGPWLPPQYGSGNIHVAGQTFVDGTGAIWKYKGCSDFMLYYRYLAAGGSAGGGAAAIAPVIAERVGLGFNVLRVFSMLFNIVNFNPASYATYYTDLPIFAALLAASGLHMEFTVLADCSLVPNMSTVIQQATHLNQVLTALAASPNVFIELGNEWQVNAFNPLNFPLPVGMVSTRASSTGGDIPPKPPWDYVVDHPPRDAEWPRKAHQLYEWRDGIPDYNPGAQRPCVANEPMGAAEVAISGKRSDVPNDFYWFAATAMLLGAGATFHSDNGIDSVLFQPVQLACAQSFLAGLNAIPAAMQLGDYTRGGLSTFPLTDDPSWMLRQYARISGTSAVAVVIRPTGSWPGAVPIAPWTIVSQTGPSNTVITLTL